MRTRAACRIAGGLAALAGLAMLVAVALSGCGHFRRHTTENHQEATKARWEEAATSAKSETTAAQQTTTKKRDRRTRWLRPDGTAWKEELDGLAQVSQAHHVSAVEASASRQATVDKQASSSGAKTADVKAAPPWWTAPWFLGLVALCLLGVGWRYRRAFA